MILLPLTNLSNSLYPYLFLTFFVCVCSNGQVGRGGADPENEKYDDDGPQGFSRDIHLSHGDHTHDVVDDDDDMHHEEDDIDAVEKEPSDGEDLDDNIDA